jgi:hypothetical protein
MSRLSFGVAIGPSLFMALLTTTAFAESQADIAAKENDEGKDLMFAGKYAEASAKFEDAAARANEPKYYFNLCTSRYQEGKFGMALTACQVAEKNGADGPLKDKTSKLEQRIRDEAKSQGIDLTNLGGGGSPDPNPVTPTGPTTPPPPDGSTGTPTPPPDGSTQVGTTQVGTTQVGTPTTVGAPPAPVYAVGRPPAGGLFVQMPPSHKYVWTLGVDFYAGGGHFGGTDQNNVDVYGNAVAGLRVKGDYLFDPVHQIGIEAYLQLSHFGATSNQMTQDMVSSLDMFDIGLAAYKHFCQGSGHFCVTPLVGAHITLMSPDAMMNPDGSEVFGYLAVGARAEVAASYAFGRHFENVFSLQVGANFYTGAFSAPSGCADGTGCSASDLGIGVGGGFAYLGVGYTYRFNTPLGRAPFVTLE